MKPHEILADKTFYEPETLRQLFPQLSEIEHEQLQVLQALTYNLAFWQDSFVFENAVLALNEVKPEIGFMQGCTPQQIWYAVQLMTKAFPTRTYSYPVKMYVKFMCNQHGVYVYPPEMFNDLENPYYTGAKLKLETTKILSDKTTIDIQAAQLAAIELYIRMKQDDEQIKVAQETKLEGYYSPGDTRANTAGGGRDFAPVWTWEDRYSTYFDDNGRIWELNNTNSILNLTPIGGANPATVSIWYKHEAASGAPTARHIINWSNSSLRALNSTNTIQCSIAGSATTSFVGTISTGPWYHLTLAYPTNVAMTSGTLYINGISQGEVAIGGAFVSSTTRLGNSSLGSPIGRLKGYINDLAVWNTVLSSGEIYQLATNKFDYRLPLGTYNKQNNLVEYYLMGDGAFSNPLTSTTIPNIVNPTQYFYSPSGTIAFSGIVQ